jgi:hypothetical protein
MKIRSILLIPFLTLFAALSAQEVQNVNVRMKGENFERFVEQVEAQTSLKFYYSSRWFEGRTFSFDADSIPPEEALYELLKGTGLLFNRLEGDRIIILPEKRLSMNLPGTSSTTGSFGELQQHDAYMGVRGDLYLSGTRPERMVRTIEVG